MEMLGPEEAVEYVKAECARAGLDEEKALMWYYTAFRMRGSEETVGIGDTVGNYRIVKRLGRGGIARVYLAEHKVVGSNFAAIKVFRKDAVTVDGEEVWRGDPALLSRCNHDNIVRFYDAGMTEDKTPYVIMEYVEGQHIADFCNGNLLTVRQRLELFRDLCAVISYVHGKDIAHLDLKPSNILVTSAPEGKLKLIDFGAGKLLRFVAHEGAPPPSRFARAFSLNYASPEHLKGEYERVNEVSDIYSLGAVLYRLLTDQPALDLARERREEVRHIVSNRLPLPPSRLLERLGAVEIPEGDSGAEAAVGDVRPLDTISSERRCQPEQLVGMLRGDLDAIVLKCLEKEPAKRYRTVGELDADIDRYLRSLPVAARRRQSWLYKARKYTAMLLGVKPGHFGWPKWRVAALRFGLLAALLLSGSFAVWRTFFRSLPTPVTETRQFRVMHIGENRIPHVDEKSFPMLIQNLAGGVNIDLVQVSAPPENTFTMGSNGEGLDDSPEDQLQRRQEFPAHEAAIQTFYLGRTEVTQAQWRAVAALRTVNVELDSDPSETKGNLSPVTNVSYIDAVEFCDRLSRATGLRYRLPTEAEWEYACRARSGSVYGTGDTLDEQVANFRDARGDKPLAATRKLGNAFGLYNMNGNVWEWTQDLWHPSYEGNTNMQGGAWTTEIMFPDKDGFLLKNTDYRVLRGGAFDSGGKLCRCASRTNGMAFRQDVGRNEKTGFRIGLSLN